MVSIEILSFDQFANETLSSQPQTDCRNIMRIDDWSGWLCQLVTPYSHATHKYKSRHTHHTTQTTLFYLFRFYGFFGCIVFFYCDLKFFFLFCCENCKNIWLFYNLPCWKNKQIKHNLECVVKLLKVNARHLL